MRKTDISLFLDNFKEGGVQRAILNLARGLIELNFEVDIVVYKKTGPFLKQLPEGIKVVDLGNPRLRSSIPTLAKYLQREQPRALIASLHYSTEIAILAKLYSQAHTKVAVCEQGAFLALPSVQPSLKNLAYLLGLTPSNPKTLVRFLYPFADKVVGVSNGVCEDLAVLIGNNPTKLHTIYNPVITPELIAKAKEPVEHPWLQPNQIPVILATGRLEAQKDFPTLIQAFAQVRKLKPARLMILGTGSQRPQLEELIRQLNLEADVALPGFVDNPYAYMSKSAVFVLSSIWEGLGNVLIEAMAAGVPVVSTNCKSGPDEILAYGKYGDLVPVGNIQEIAEAILRVLSGQIKSVDSDWLEQFMIKPVARRYLEILDLSAPSA
ncbi:glycosyltransferase [Aerosakkonemataceae cyanobacterium BLCC-F50]|uniref:Glycosyltransferase n=1 Tax=Floridaenema flaviceps BLCC-F50 TaxID=3153642 RepID=A0ABV4XSN6_9CYAN